MPQAAVPHYLGRDFSTCPPGHRFTLYGDFWEPEQGWSRMKNIDPAALKHAFGRLPDDIAKLRDALCARQESTARALGTMVITLPTRSISPFVTGTGIEHPMENGMAFLNPYGLPYLPGTSVKGVLRWAAEELRNNLLGDGTQGWDQGAIDLLFGRETESGDTESERTRGALVFWDVFPRCDRLAVEIMNPHYGDYYQGNSTPHDAGQPIPIYFLVVPEKTDFAFHVQCDPERLPEDWPEERWRQFIDTAFKHAFDWLGFGAKTAVGYGAMALPDAAEHASAQPFDQAAQQQSTTPSANQQRWDNATLRWEPGSQTVIASVSDKLPARLQGVKVKEFLNELPEDIRARLLKKKEIKGVSLVIEVIGNQATLVGLAQGSAK